MQNQTLNEFVLLPVPSEVMEEAGITPDTLIQFSVEGGKLIVELVDEVTPLLCDGECHNCPAQEQTTNDQLDVTLLEFLNNLSDKQQRAALIHLSVLWAQKTGDNLSD